MAIHQSTREVPFCSQEHCCSPRKLCYHVVAQESFSDETIYGIRQRNWLSARKAYSINGSDPKSALYGSFCSQRIMNQCIGQSCLARARDRLLFDGLTFLKEILRVRLDERTCGQLQHSFCGHSLRCRLHCLRRSWAVLTSRWVGSMLFCIQFGAKMTQIEGFDSGDRVYWGLLGD